MPKAPRYTDEQRAEAVALLQAAGYPNEKGALTKTANQLGIPARTISRWFNGENNPPPDKTVTEKTFDLREAIRGELQAVLEAMPDKRENANYRDLVTAAGILTDKLTRLDGNATEIVEIRADARTDLMDKLNQVARKQASSIPTGTTSSDYIEPDE